MTMPKSLCKSSRSSSLSRLSGFTLIELMVVITVMALLFGTGIASYRRLERRQSLLNVCRKIQELALTAQKRARVGDRPASCITATSRLSSYRVRQVGANPFTVRLEALCTNPASTVTIEDFDISSRFTLTSMGTMTFRVLHGGLEETTSTITAQSASPNYRCTMTVDGGGSMTPISIVTY